jgi:hypothetical protein
VPMKGISRWVCGSMPPGMTKHPAASITSVPERPVPIALMLSPSMRISDLKLRSAATMSPPLIKRDIIFLQQQPAASFRSSLPPPAHPREGGDPGYFGFPLQFWVPASFAGTSG